MIIYYIRHCEQSEAIQGVFAQHWIAASPLAPRNDDKEGCLNDKIL